MAAMFALAAAAPPQAADLYDQAARLYSRQQFEQADHILRQAAQQDCVGACKTGKEQAISIDNKGSTMLFAARKQGWNRQNLKNAKPPNLAR